jgi:CRISPR-associated protein Csb1
VVLLVVVLLVVVLLVVVLLVVVLLVVVLLVVVQLAVVLLVVVLRKSVPELTQHLMMEAKTVDMTQFDKYIQSTDWLQETGLPVAITLTEVLEPSEGKDAIIFPPTFATRSAIPYQIDELRSDIAPPAAQPGEEVNTCLIDSVGSQANRMESCFKLPPLADLVPQVEIELEINLKEEAQDGGEQSGDAGADKSKAPKKQKIQVNLLDVGHRVADGAVRFSEFSHDAHDAISQLKDAANAEPLARLAPTSLIFGFWDSRPGTTLFKFGRILSSTIRATNVVSVKRSAQFNPAFDPSQIGFADELPEGADESQSNEDIGTRTADGKDPLSRLGLRAAPATGKDSLGTHGGVRVFGQIVRRTQINLVGLRALAVTGKDNAGKLTINKEETLTLRRYLLGLALVAAQCQTHYKLREGCLLVRSHEIAPQFSIVFPDGKREDCPLNLAQSFSFAEEAAASFGVKSPHRPYRFDMKRAKSAVDQLKPTTRTRASRSRS